MNLLSSLRRAIKILRTSLAIMISLLVLGFLQSSLTFSQETTSVNALIEEALRNSPELLAVRKRWEASLARVPQSKALTNPMISFSTMNSDGVASVSQVFEIAGKLSLKEKIAVVESQMIAAEYKDKELELISLVRNVCYELFLNEKEIELKQASLLILQEVARISEAGYATGTTPLEEVLKINLEIAKLMTDLENLRIENRTRQTRLNLLLNRDPEEIMPAPIVSETTDFSCPIDSLYLLAIENQAELQVLRYSIEKARLAESLAKKSTIPDLMVGLGIRSAMSGSFGPLDLMLSLPLPVWYWKKERYQVKEAISNVEEAEAAYQAMKNHVLFEVKDLYSRLNMIGNRIDLLKLTVIPSLEACFESSIADFRTGRVGPLDLLEIQRMILDARMEYYREVTEWNKSLADLEQMTGVSLKR